MTKVLKEITGVVFPSYDPLNSYLYSTGRLINLPDTIVMPTRLTRQRVMNKLIRKSNKDKNTSFSLGIHES